MNIQTIALVVVGVIGALITVMSVAGMVRPDQLVALVRRTVASRYGIFFAVVTRALLGASLLIAAPLSAFAGAFTVLGWLILASAAVVALFQARLLPLLDWLAARGATVGRAIFLLGAAVGVFFVYGAIPASTG